MYNDYRNNWRGPSPRMSRNFAPPRGGFRPTRPHSQYEPEGRVKDSKSSMGQRGNGSDNIGTYGHQQPTRQNQGMQFQHRQLNQHNHGNFGMDRRTQNDMIEHPRNQVNRLGQMHNLAGQDGQNNFSDNQNFPVKQSEMTPLNQPPPFPIGMINPDATCISENPQTRVDTFVPHNMQPHSSYDISKPPPLPPPHMPPLVNPNIPPPPAMGTSYNSGLPTTPNNPHMPISGHQNASIPPTPNQMQPPYQPHLTFQHPPPSPHPSPFLHDPQHFHQSQNQTSQQDSQEFQQFGNQQGSVPPFPEFKNNTHGGCMGHGSNEGPKEPFVKFDRNFHGNDAVVGNTSKSEIKQNDSSSGGITEDERWLADWLRKRSQKVTKPQPSTSNISIPKYKTLVQQSLSLQSKLGTCCRDLKESIEDGELWERKSQEALAIKHELESILAQLDDEEMLKQVQTRFKRNRSKRERLKRQRKEQYNENIEIEKKREELHQMIDSQRNAVQLKYLEEKREKEVKAAADSVLSEVRRKLSETSRRLEALNALVKLRKLRKVSAERKGLYASMESDRIFESGIQEMITLLSKQKDIYEREQQTLKVMLEIEQEESKEKLRLDEEKKEQKREQQRERKIKHRLFGKQDVDHSIKPYQHFYLQAEGSLEALVHIRREWDNYLVPPGTVGSSKIPLGWVDPPEPSTDVWSSVLKQNQ